MRDRARAGMPRRRVMRMELELPEGMPVDHVFEQVSAAICGVLAGPARAERRRDGRAWLVRGAVHAWLARHTMDGEAGTGGGRVIRLVGPANMDFDTFCAVLAYDVAEP